MDPTTLLFDEKHGKFKKLSAGDPTVSHFVWDTSAESLDQEEELMYSSLKWATNVMTLIKLVGDDKVEEDVSALQLNKTTDTVTIYGRKKYIGKVKQLISLESDNVFKQPESLDDIFNYLKDLIYVPPSSSSPSSSISGSQQSSTSRSSASLSRVTPPSPLVRMNADNSCSTSSSQILPTTPLARPTDSTKSVKKLKRKSGSMSTSKSPKYRKVISSVKVKTKRELEIEEMEIVKSRFIRSSNELQGRPAITIRRIKLSELLHDTTIRGINYNFVDEIVQAMATKVWQHDQTVFIVLFDKKTGKYFVLDGNHRLEGYLRYNQTAAEPYSNVKCKVYDSLSYEEILIVTQPSNTVLKKLDLTELQMAKLALELIDSRKLVIPKHDAHSRSVFNELMKSAIGPDFLVIATEIIQNLPRFFVYALEKVQYNGMPMSFTKFPARFWRVLFTAAKKNIDATLVVLHGLSKSSVDAVQKRLGQIDYDLLRHLSSYGPHTFKSRDDAADFITGNAKTSSTIVKSLIVDSRALSNYARKKTVVDWLDVQQNVQKYIKEKSQCKNVQFIGNVNQSFSQYNFMIVYDPSSATLDFIRPCCENAVVVLLSAFHEEPPKISSLNPALKLQLLVRPPPIIDSIVDELPAVSIAADVYIPDMLDCPDEQRIVKLSSLAAEKECRLATMMLLEDIFVFGRLAKEHASALVSHVKFNGVTKLLNNLSDFENLHIVGDAETQKCVEQLLLKNRKENLSRKSKTKKSESYESTEEEDNDDPTRMLLNLSSDGQEEEKNEEDVLLQSD